MFRKNFSIFFIVLLTVSCSTGNQLTSLQYKDYRIEKQGKADSSLVKMLQPYAISLNATMDKVIGFSNTNLNAKQPESGIGNFMADCMQVMAEKNLVKK